jgi:hypothetical protein
MANRKKAEQDAINFSKETAAPAKPKVAKPAKPKIVASPALPGLRKAQAEAAVKPHKRAVADRAKRQEEIAKGVEEARMPGQSEAEARWAADRPSKKDRLKAAADKLGYQKWLHDNTAVSPEEEAKVKELRRKGAKGKPRGGRGPR